MTHVGTALFCFPAFANLSFFAVGLFLANIISFLWSVHVFAIAAARVFASVARQARVQVSFPVVPTGLAAAPTVP